MKTIYNEKQYAERSLIKKQIDKKNGLTLAILCKYYFFEKNKNKKPGLMQRMMDQQAEMLKQQEQAKKGGRADYNAETEGMSKSERNKYNRELINEARKRMAEKYGDEYREDDSE